MKATQPLSLPNANRVVGKLYLPSETAELTDSMLSVTVGEFGIDVSWYPDRDPTGRYYVNVYRGEWENTVETYDSPDPREVASFVESQVAALVSTGAVPVRDDIAALMAAHERIVEELETSDAVIRRLTPSSLTLRSASQEVPTNATGRHGATPYRFVRAPAAGKGVWATITPEARVVTKADDRWGPSGSRDSRSTQMSFESAAG